MTLKESLTLKVGDKVHYKPDFWEDNDKFENGRVKRIDKLNVFVVYLEIDDWKNYTAQRTHIRDLHKGWLQKSNQIYN